MAPGSAASSTCNLDSSVNGEKSISFQLRSLSFCPICPKEINFFQAISTFTITTNIGKADSDCFLIALYTEASTTNKFRTCISIYLSAAGSKKNYLRIKKNYTRRDQPQIFSGSKKKLRYTKTPLGACLCVPGRIKKNY